MAQRLTDLRDAGANAVALVVQLHQDTMESADVHPALTAPSDDLLGRTIDLAHASGLEVAIVIHADVAVCTTPSCWRGNFAPTNRQEWFASYTGQVTHYAKIAAAHDAQSLSIGTEMESLNTPADRPEWATLIARVRDVFNGKVTYATNWDYFKRGPRADFWPLLDYTSITGYKPLGSTPEISNLKAAWAEWDQQAVAPLALFGKPIVIGEVGWRSIPGAYADPATYDKTGMDAGPVDQQEQARDYEAFFEYWTQRPYLKGAQFWRWETDDLSHHKTDFTPQGKAAENVIRTWFTAPPPAITQVSRRKRTLRPTPFKGPDLVAVQIREPAEGQRVAGLFTVRAVTQGAGLQTPEVWWTVDGGQKNPMTPSSGGSWSADIDVSTWHWNSNGHYLLSVCAQAPETNTFCDSHTILVVSPELTQGSNQQ